MKLSLDLVQQTLFGVKQSLPSRRFKLGCECIRIGDRSASLLAPQVTLLPRSAGARRSATVTLRSLKPSGITFSDSSYWLDGEEFLLPLPVDSDGRCRAIVCAVTHWELVSTGVFRVSGQFIRLVQLPGSGTVPRRSLIAHTDS